MDKRIVSGDRGGRILVVDGHRYHKHRENNNSISWRCWRKECRARVKTNNAAFQSPRANGAHDFEVGKIPVQPYVAFHSRTEPRWLIVLSCSFLLCLLLALINSVNRVFVLQKTHTLVAITHMLLYKPDTTTN